MTESIDDRLSRLAKEFDKMLGKPIQDTESPADVLARFGFTLTEAEAWLKQESDFNKPIFKRRDKKLTEPIRLASNLSYPASPYRSWVRVLDLANPPAACLSK